MRQFMSNGRRQQAFGRIYIQIRLPGEREEKTCKIQRAQHPGKQHGLGADGGNRQKRVLLLQCVVQCAGCVKNSLCIAGEHARRAVRCQRRRRIQLFHKQARCGLKLVHCYGPGRYACLFFKRFRVISKAPQQRKARVNAQCHQHAAQRTPPQHCQPPSAPTCQQPHCAAHIPDAEQNQHGPAQLGHRKGHKTAQPSHCPVVWLYDLVHDKVRCGAAAHHKAQRQQKRAHRSQCEIQLFVAPPRPRRGGFCSFSPHPSAPQLIDKRKHFVHLLRLQGRVSAFKRLLHAAADMRF